MSTGCPRNRNGPPHRRLARRWHRWLGAIFTLPLLWLAISGVVLNHAEGLGLNRKVVRSQWLLERYGMVPDGEARGAPAGTRRVAEWGKLLFIDEVLQEEEGRLVGAVGAGADLVIATTAALYVYAPDGSLVDVLGELALPALPVERVGVAADGAVVVAAAGETWKAGGDYLEFAPADGTGVAWSAPAAVDRAPLRTALAEGAGIPWSRVILDLHSGNLFGRAGSFLVDLTGIAVVVLTLLGVKLLFKKMR